MSDTPRTEAVNQYLRTRRDYTKTDHEVWMNHGIQIELELNAANERIKRLEAVVNDPHALWTNWLRGDVKLPAGIGDVRQYQQRIKRLEDAGDALKAAGYFGGWGDAVNKWVKVKEAKL